MTTTVAILGASNHHYRYAWKAQQLLAQHGHQVVPVALRDRDIGGVPAYTSVADIPFPIDTVTVYLSPDKVDNCVRDILAIKPRRVIFNPGSESPAAFETIPAQGIEVTAACTLVLLRTGQF